MISRKDAKNAKGRKEWDEPPVGSLPGLRQMKRMDTDKTGIKMGINERMNVARGFGGDSIMFCIAYLFWVLGGKDVHMFINLKKRGFLQGFGVGLGRNARRFAEMGVCMNIYVYIQG